MIRKSLTKSLQLYERLSKHEEDQLIHQSLDIRHLDRVELLAMDIFLQNSFHKHVQQKRLNKSSILTVLRLGWRWNGAIWHRWKAYTALIWASETTLFKTRKAWSWCYCWFRWLIYSILSAYQCHIQTKRNRIEYDLFVIFINGFEDIEFSHCSRCGCQLHRIHLELVMRSLEQFL